MKRFATVTIALIMVMSFIAIVYAVNLTPAVKDDPLVRMPGTQPDQGVNLEAPNRCLNCHGGYNQAVEPGYNWKGSMMAQASRDPIFWACLTVAGQDSAWAIGTPNAVDICERCHFPEGWLGGRSDPPNASAMTGSDYDGLHCDFCHTKWDPFFETTYAGTREGDDWLNYWDETNASSTPSQPAADATYQENMTLSQAITNFSGSPFFVNNLPFSENYIENATGQYFVSTGSQKRASFADAAARHQMLYSRYHKSKYFCATCHDVSNPALANLGQDGTQPLTTETDPAYSYFHVERTWSEFMSSAYGQQGGAPTNPEFQAQGAPDITQAAKCQDCHMRDVVGVACNKNGVPIRPDESTEHPNSGQPLHDLTGGNAWISYILASAVPGSSNYDSFNDQQLNQGPAALTLDLTQGEGIDPVALLAGSDRAKQQLRLAATIKNLAYSGGNVTFQLQNNSAHKLISGFPEGRRMFVNIQAKDAAGNIIYEVNPYDDTIGTLKGLPHSHSSPALGANEAYVDELVYEVHPSSSLTGEAETFHFVLADGRYKDNRIPPKGFDLARATPRISEPVWHGASDPGYFTAQEYAGGYDEISLSDHSQANLPNNTASVIVTLYYQGTSREYIEFLRDEINGNQNLTLPTTLGVPGPADPANYIIQSDPFFAQLKAWGNTIWQLWEHNHAAGVEGIVPFMMAQATVGGEAPCAPPVPTLLSATAGDSQVMLTWHEIPGDPAVLGYNLYYDQAGKAQFIATLSDPAANNHVDTGLTNGQEYCYKVTSLYDCDGNGESDTESGFSNILCATPTNPGQTVNAGVDAMQTGKWVTTGKGKNQTTEFVVTDSFNAGDGVVVQVYVVDEGAIPLADAIVEIIINDAGGNLVATLLTDPSDATGWTETTWQTQQPNKKGQGGTPVGAYEAVTNNVTVSGYVWDGVMTSAPISIQ